MSIDPLTLGLVGGSISLATSLFNRPKSPKLPEVQQFRPSTEYGTGGVAVNPALRYISPFSTVQEQELFRKQQENLLNLRLYVPKEKLGE